jgi:hypothetical protein
MEIPAGGMPTLATPKDPTPPHPSVQTLSTNSFPEAMTS